MTAPDPIALSSDLEAVLGAPVDAERADRLIELATAMCLGVVDPLPLAAKGTVLSIAARAYVNGANVTQQMAGPIQAGFSNGGLRLTRQEIADLRRAAGRGGAFTIDPTPADAGTEIPWYEQNTSWPWPGYWERNS